MSKSDYYNRYNGFVTDGQVWKRVPFVSIPIEETDIFVNYDKSQMRLDMLSYKYYGDPNYGWLILQSNPKYGGYEFSIPNGVQYRIPYPLSSAISRYESSVTSWKRTHVI